ncbi:MAG: TlpA family protein disulfide reductase, partial [Bacteroidales bacterium]|nr:TlpA family protein disulfide reductase [Bacteroidales bacterium]
MKKIISFLAAALFACVILNAQNFSKVEIQTEDGGKTTPAHWVDHKTPYVVSFWFVTCKYCIEEMDAISEVFDEWQKEAPFRFI